MEKVQKTKFNVWKKIKSFLHYFHQEYIKFPLYIMAHPLKGFEEFKREKRAKLSVAIVMIITLIIVNILAFQYNGMEINDKDIKDLNSFAQIAYIIGPVILITFSNWFVTTLFDGKGKLKEIFMMVGYCLFPLIWAEIFGMILSNVLTGTEMAVYTLVIGLGVFLMIYMAFMGMISIHEYGVGKCVLTIIFTLLAAVILIFICLLCFELFQKIYGFFYTLYREITIRDLI